MATRATWVERLSSLGASAQASVLGLYAWAITVAPAAWSHGAPAVSRVAAGLAVAALAGGVLGERRWGDRARMLSLWGFVLMCALAWSAAPTAMSAVSIDAPRGLAGMLGWGLYAFACAGPALQGARSVDHVIQDGDELEPRRGLRRGDSLYLVGAALLAALLQLPGWQTPTPERALLVRLVALAAGLAVLGAGTEVGLARHLPRSRRPRGTRLRRATTALLVLALITALGILFVLKS